MDAIQSRVRRYPLLVFYFLALGFSWTLWAMMIASARGLLPFSFSTNWTGSFGPAVAALITTALLSGRKGVNTLLKSAGMWRFGGRWWLLAVFGGLLPPFAGLAFYVVFNGFTGGVSEFIGQLPLLPVYWVIVFVLGGPMGEEIGWRGFALPHLLKSRSPAIASLILGIGWFVWHIPLFWLEGAAQKGNSVVLFALAVLCFSVLFTWIYIRTGGSLLAALVFHTGINSPSLLVSAEATFTDSSIVQGTEMGLWLAATVLVLVLDRRTFFAKPFEK